MRLHNVLPIPLTTSFRAARHIPYTYIDVVTKLNKAGRSQQRVLLCTATHLYSCIPSSGDVQRCIAFSSVAQLRVCRNHNSVAVIVPNEYDLLVQTKCLDSLERLLFQFPERVEFVEQEVPLGPGGSGEGAGLRLEKPPAFARVTPAVVIAGGPKVTLQELRHLAEQQRQQKRQQHGSAMPATEGLNTASSPSPSSSATAVRLSLDTSDRSLGNHTANKRSSSAEALRPADRWTSVVTKEVPPTTNEGEKEPCGSTAEAEAAANPEPAASSAAAAVAVITPGPAISNSVDNNNNNKWRIDSSAPNVWEVARASTCHQDRVRDDGKGLELRSHSAQLHRVVSEHAVGAGATEAESRDARRTFPVRPIETQKQQEKQRHQGQEQGQVDFLLRQLEKAQARTAEVQSHFLDVVRSQGEQISVLQDVVASLQEELEYLAIENMHLKRPLPEL